MTFSDIVAKCRADDIVNMLNDMYHRFDTHTDSYAVYKVHVVCSGKAKRSGVACLSAGRKCKVGTRQLFAPFFFTFESRENTTVSADINFVSSTDELPSYLPSSMLKFQTSATSWIRHFFRHWPHLALIQQSWLTGRQKAIIFLRVLTRLSPKYHSPALILCLKLKRRTL